MYAEHVPIIAAAMRQEHSVFCRGVMFAALSARVQFPRVPDQCKELQMRGADASCLWGWKFDAFAYLQDHKNELYGQVATALDPARALWDITRIPGMGIVKGAFVLQLLGHDVACLDVRSIIREGREPRAYRSDGEDRKRAPAFCRKIDRYLADVSGKAQHYWDTWCKDVAADYNSTPNRISELHLTSIVPRAYRHLTMAVPVRPNELPF
jgi:hypothetical protein